MKIRAGLFAVLWWMLPGACQAQIYGGLTDSGSILLTTNLDGDVSVVVAAPEIFSTGPDVADPAGDSRFHARMGFAQYVREASQAYRLPAELIHAVIQVESNFNPRAVSPKGAQGLMQLMPRTAVRFGSRDNFDPRENIMAGSRYLRWLMDYFQQDLELTLAAYNAGEGAVMQAGRRIPRFSETEKYVPKVLAQYRKALRLI